MSFSFKFDIPDAEDADLEQSEPTESECKHLTKPVAPFEEVVPSHELENLHESLEKSVLDLTSIKVTFIVGGQMESLLKGDVLEAAEGNLDIIPSVYEGGMKVWECSIDLTEYIENHLSIDDESKVLELGCGAGLPGLLACLKGAFVDFQDYNKQVLELITIPNAFSNIGIRVKKRCHFYAGDWSALADNIAPSKYDFILTSETIYNTTSYPSLIAVLKKAIKHTGVVLVAAKTCYFGVGGGTRLFEDALAVDGFFRSRVVFTTNSGVQREILELRVAPLP
ncbi:histidine protein methyltransferase 1 homolog [Rhipicephalus microplus]|uniref:histidine protein methyltransferase 1 homolog n=1 Tax=Rhipicephalus microplus TaxID=6941 RepID=UPI0023769E88